MQGSTTFWVFEFGKLEFSMVLEFHELKFYGKILKNFDGTRVPRT